MPEEKLTKEFVLNACSTLTKQQFAARFARSTINEMHCIIVGYYAPVILTTKTVVDDIYKAVRGV